MKNKWQVIEKGTEDEIYLESPMTTFINFKKNEWYILISGRLQATTGYMDFCQTNSETDLINLWIGGFSKICPNLVTPDFKKKKKKIRSKKLQPNNVFTKDIKNSYYPNQKGSLFFTWKARAISWTIKSVAKEL